MSGQRAWCWIPPVCTHTRTRGVVNPSIYKYHEASPVSIPKAERLAKRGARRSQAIKIINITLRFGPWLPANRRSGRALRDARRGRVPLGLRAPRPRKWVRQQARQGEGDCHDQPAADDIGEI